MKVQRISAFILFMFLSACNHQTASEKPERQYELTGIVADHTDHVKVVMSTKADDIDGYIRFLVEKANERGLKPFLYFTADWCAPCQEIKKQLNNPLMIDAFKGTFLIEVDVDDHEAVAEKFGINAIPAWSGVHQNGKSNGNYIRGDAWGENTPENMAPVLKAYFSK